MSKEKYPSKRAYATGKLYKWLKKNGFYEEFKIECKRQNEGRGHKELSEAFTWYNSIRGYNFWNKVDLKIAEGEDW